MLRLTKNNISPGRPSRRDAVTSLTIRSKRIPSEDQLYMGLQISRPDKNHAGGLRRIHEYRPHAPGTPIRASHGLSTQACRIHRSISMEDCFRAMSVNVGQGTGRAWVAWSHSWHCRSEERRVGKEGRSRWSLHN